MKPLRELFLENIKSQVLLNGRNISKSIIDDYIVICDYELERYKETQENIVGFIFDGNEYNKNKFIFWTDLRVYMLLDNGIEEYVKSVPRNPTTNKMECF